MQVEKNSAKLILMYSVIAWQYVISLNLVSFFQAVQCLFILQQSSLCAVVTWPLFYISDINLVCSIVFCFGVVAPIVVCKQHTEKRPRVNFLQPCTDLVCALKRYLIPLTLGWEESEKSSSLECTCAIRGTLVPSLPFASSSFMKITMVFTSGQKTNYIFIKSAAIAMWGIHNR